MREKLSPFHITILIFTMQQGVVIFSLPRLLADHVGYNGWASLFIFSIIIAINIYLISLVYRLGDGKSIFEILEHSIPKIIVFPCYAALIVLWTVSGCLILKKYIFILQFSVFPTVHPMYIKAFIDVLLYSFVIKGIYTIGKIATIFYFMVCGSILFLLFLLKDFHITNLTPFIFENGSHNPVGWLNIMISFLGYELALLLFPYVSNKGFIKSVHIGNLLTTLTNVTISLICFGFYSFNQLTDLKYPLVDLFAYIKLPIVERIDNLIFAMYFLTTLVGSAIYFWAALEATRRITPNANIKLLTAFLILLGFIISWIPDTLGQVRDWLNYFGYTELSVAFGLPIILLLVLFFSKGARKHV